MINISRQTAALAVELRASTRAALTDEISAWIWRQEARDRSTGVAFRNGRTDALDSGGKARGAFGCTDTARIPVASVSEERSWGTMRRSRINLLRATAPNDCRNTMARARRLIRHCASDSGTRLSRYALTARNAARAVPRRRWDKRRPIGIHRRAKRNGRRG